MIPLRPLALASLVLFGFAPVGCRSTNGPAQPPTVTVTNDPHAVARCQYVGDVAAVAAWNRTTDPDASQQQVETTLRKRAGRLGANTVYVADGSVSGVAYHCGPSAQR